MKTSQIPLLAFFLLFIALDANFARCTSILDAIDTAYTKNSLLNAERAALDGVSENLKQAKSSYLPSITLDSSYGDVKSGDYQLQTGLPGDGDFDRNPLSHSLTITQDIFSGFKNYHEYQKAAAEILQAEASLAKIEQKILLNVVQAYINVLIDQEKLKFSQKNKKFLEKRYELSSQQFSLGEISKVDLKQSEAALSVAIANLEQSKLNLDKSKVDYENVVGEKALDLEPINHTPLLPASLDEAIEIAKKSYPLLVEAQQSEVISQHKLKKKYSNFMPSLSLSGSYTQSYDSTSSLDYYNQKEITAQLSWPLFQGGKNKSALRKSREELNEATLILINTEKETIAEVQHVWNNYFLQGTKIRAAESSLEAAQLSLDATVASYEVGESITIDVLEAQQGLLEAQIYLITSINNKYYLSYKLLSTMGLLSRANLINTIE